MDPPNAHQDTEKTEARALTGAKIVIIAHHFTAFKQKVPPSSGWIRTAKGRDKQHDKVRMFEVC